MALYIDCAYLDDIIQVAKTIPLAGVTMNPTILLAARERGQRLDPLSLLRELVQSVGGTIFMQPGATREEEMLKEALAYIEVAPGRVIPKIPMTQTGMRVALRLRLLKHSVAFTAVCSVAQAYSGAMAQADFVIPYFNRMERAGVDASERIAQMAELLHSQQLPTRILAASIKTRVEAATALLAGAHDLTMTPAVLLDMVVDQQSERAVEQFSQDWQKMNTL
ncbi:MAG TPA: transaldolase family protein [Ktedonobacteraceae bacterium]|nr:transaldolase family protein [Ktedonobacteraceae bacterium]